MNGERTEGGGVMGRLALALGCTEGRAYTLTLGFVLAGLLAIFVVPATRIDILAAAPATPQQAAATLPPPTAPPATPRPPTTGGGASSSGGQPASPSATEAVPTTTGVPVTATPTTGFELAPVPETPPREVVYTLPPEFRPLEIAVANIVQDGCTQLSLINGALGNLPAAVRDPITESAALDLLSQVYLACAAFPFPEAELVCDIDVQVITELRKTPLGGLFTNFPPVIGHIVASLTAPTDVAFGLLGIEDPLLGATLKLLLGCDEVAQ